MDRKLTTILAADVIGYSKLMARDEEATLRSLRECRRVSDALIDKHGGRIFNTGGDSVLAEFGSAVEAVRCAISIQEDLRIRNVELSEERQMWLRIGINVGDVVVENGDLFGDGVNIAARLEGLADKGGICISDSTFAQVKNKLSIAFQDIGPQLVKNIPEAVSAYRLVPGDVNVAKADSAACKPRMPSRRPRNGRPGLILAAVPALIVAAGAAFAWVFLPSATVGNHPFDGAWQVTVDELSRCSDNDPRGYSMTVVEGEIDEPNQPFPKTGTVSSEGEFHIIVKDRAGNVMNTQTGNIDGDLGEGRFRGKKPGCSGLVSLVRLQ